MKSLPIYYNDLFAYAKFEFEITGMQNADIKSCSKMQSLKTGAKIISFSTVSCLTNIIL